MRNKRSHLCRAKDSRKKTWVKGYVWQGLECSYIIPLTSGVTYDDITQKLTSKAIRIDPSTLCDCTDACDYYDTDIYEHDIIFNPESPNQLFLIRQVSCQFVAYAIYPEIGLVDDDYIEIHKLKDFLNRKYEIVGNEFDDAKLLKGFNLDEVNWHVR